MADPCLPAAYLAALRHSQPVHTHVHAHTQAVHHKVAHAVNHHVTHASHGVHAAHPHVAAAQAPTAVVPKLPACGDALHVPGTEHVLPSLPGGVGGPLILPAPGGTPVGGFVGGAGGGGFPGGGVLAPGSAFPAGAIGGVGAGGLALAGLGVAGAAALGYVGSSLLYPGAGSPGGGVGSGGPSYGQGQAIDYAALTTTPGGIGSTPGGSGGTPGITTNGSPGSTTPSVDVPEPSSLAVMLAACVAVALLRAHRRITAR